MEFPEIAEKECNMKAPKDQEKKQKVFLVQGIDSQCLRLLIKAFNINRELKHEMQLGQLITKVVPFTRSKFNDKIIEGDSTDE